MLANTVQVRKLVNDTLNSVPFNYCGKSWTDRDWRKIADDGKRRVSFEIASNDLLAFSRQVKQAFIDNGFDNTVNVTNKYIRVASKI
jgi:hypothetical protein